MPVKEQLNEHKGAWYTLDELITRKAYMVDDDIYRKIRFMDEVVEDGLIQIGNRYFKVFLSDTPRKRFYLERTFDYGD